MFFFLLCVHVCVYVCVYLYMCFGTVCTPRSMTVFVCVYVCMNVCMYATYCALGECMSLPYVDATIISLVVYR